MILAGISFCVVFYTLMMFLFIFLKSNTKLLHVNYTVGAVNVISDLYILAIPIYAVSMLQLATRKKVGIMAIFLTGILWVGRFVHCFSLEPTELTDCLLQRVHHEHSWPLLSSILRRGNGYFMVPHSCLHRHVSHSPSFFLLIIHPHKPCPHLTREIQIVPSSSTLASCAAACLSSPLWLRTRTLRPTPAPLVPASSTHTDQRKEAPAARGYIILGTNIPHRGARSITWSWGRPQKGG